MARSRDEDSYQPGRELSRLATDEPARDASLSPADNSALPVFRLRNTRPLRWATLAVLLASVVCAAAFPASTARARVLVVLVAAGFLGSSLARLFARDVCADPSCGHALPRFAGRCPGCRGAIRGVIYSPEERHAAELRLLRRERRRAGRNESALEAAHAIVADFERNKRDE